MKKGSSSLPQIHQKTSALTNVSNHNLNSSQSLNYQNQHSNGLLSYGPNHRSVSSLSNLNSTYQLALKSKSPSCKKIFGESFTKQKIPISSLSVTKYKQLLAPSDNDPKHPDISLHIPVDSTETQNYLKQQIQIQEQNQFHPKSKQSKLPETQNEYQANSMFIPFRNSKEINRNQFIKFHQENPSFQNLDFHELYSQDGDFDRKKLGSQDKLNGKGKMNHLGIVNGNAEEDDENSSDEEGDNEYGINITNSYRRVHNGKYVNSSQSLGQRPPNKIELSLIHNKDIQSQLKSSLLYESWNHYSEVQDKLEQQQAIIKNMPKVRQYPIFKNKKLTSMHGAAENPETAPVANEESKENSNQAGNSYRQAGSTRQISGKAINVNGVGNGQPSENDPLNNKFNDEDDKKVRFQNSVQGNYSVYWYSFEQNHWKPDIREYQTLIVESKRGYLFGGVGKELYNTIVELDLETFKWNEIKTSQMSGNIPTARFGHSCHVYKKCLIFFGGEYRTTQNQVKFKDCLLDVYQYNLENRSWKYITCTGGPLQPRRNHASCIIGRNLLVHGGVNNKDQSLKDMWFLDLGTQTWSEAQVNGEFESSYHKCVPVYHSSRCGKINIYKQTEVKITKWSASIQQEGVYFFGGKNIKGEILGDLKILRTDVKPMQWIKPETKGVPPKNRYGHSIDFSQEFNFVLIHGGKNDNEPEVYFSDIFLLNVDDLNWIKISVYGRSSVARFNHSSCVFESKLVVFGGINLDGYLPPHVNVLELDNVIASKMHEREETQLNHANSITSNGKQNNLNNASEEKTLKKNLKNSSFPNIKFEHIPFSQRIKEMENDLDEQRILVNQLSFQNFKSFLPIPRFPTQPYSRPPNKRNTFLKQTINVDSQTNQMKTPTNEVQKKVSYE